MCVQFKGQLSSLMGRLSATSLHFICCMKPNTLKQPGLFDAPMVLAQLRYAGLLELCRFRKVRLITPFTHRPTADQSWSCGMRLT